jgi:hypothetical protein
MTERLSNNLLTVYLEERSQKKIYQMHWTRTTEQEIRDCFAPLYNADSATDITTEAGSGSTGEPEATSDDEGTSDDDGDNSADSGTSENDDDSN